MNGEHEEHYQINGTALDGVHERMNEDRLEKDFIEVSKVSKPKIVSFYEAWNAGILNNKGVYQPVFGETQVTALQAYGAAWLHKAPLCQSDMHQFKDDIAWKKSDHQAWGDWMRPVENNMFFHACKIQWLVHIIQNEGLYSVPQALLKTNKWFPHPGQFRVHAIEYTDCNEEFVVWDVNDRLPQKQIDFDTWYELYSHHTDKSLFAVKFEDKLEMHVGEERNDLYKVVTESVDWCNGVKISLDGTCDEVLKPLFEMRSYSGNVGIKGHFTVEDLPHIMAMPKEGEKLEKENFVLYNNYHK
tara:strand:+ start:809 stop:1708 length:900 start_codon:yes stop_codon:yes gene_type:complete